MTTDPAAALRDLAKDRQTRTKTGQIRELFEEIERTQKLGVSNKSIVEALNKSGIEINLKTFETILFRIRKERGLEKKNIDSKSEKQNKHAVDQEENKTQKTEVTEKAASNVKDAQAVADLFIKAPKFGGKK